MRNDDGKLDPQFVKNAFVIAARDGQAEIVEELLLAGVDVHAWEDVALRLAATNGEAETIKVLLNAGADVHAHGDEALEAARQKGHTEASAILKEWAQTHGRPPAPGA